MGANLLSSFEFFINLIFLFFFIQDLVSRKVDALYLFFNTIGIDKLLVSCSYIVIFDNLVIESSTVEVISDFFVFLFLKV